MLGLQARNLLLFCPFRPPPRLLRGLGNRSRRQEGGSGGGGGAAGRGGSHRDDHGDRVGPRFRRLVGHGDDHGDRHLKARIATGGSTINRGRREVEGLFIDIEDGGTVSIGRSRTIRGILGGPGRGVVDIGLSGRRA